MGAAPDEIRNEIERTRAELSRDVDRLAERTSLRRAARRSGEHLRHQARHLRERVKGAASEGAHSFGEGSGQEGESAPRPERYYHRNTTIMVGSAAFALGLLTASVVWRTRRGRPLGCARNRKMRRSASACRR